jgi:hypothetical protein
VGSFSEGVFRVRRVVKGSVGFPLVYPGTPLSTLDIPPVAPTVGAAISEPFPHIDFGNASILANLLALAFTWWPIGGKSIPYLPTGVP